MRVDEVSMRPEDEPPRDSECMRRLDLVMQGKMPLSKATVLASSVRLFDPDFAGTLKKDFVTTIAKTLLIDRKELLVYWNGSHFVSSDDYYVFLAYEVLAEKHLPVVIMGDSPKGVSITEKGGRKLLPSILIIRDTAMPGVTPQLLAWQEEQKSIREKRLLPPADLMARWLVFAELLAVDDIKERELHDFLDKNPIIMGAHWDTVQSEVRFARQYKADFVMRSDRALPKVQLVELERASHRIFTKDLHETDEITHAVQQVSDWLRWWRQNPQDPIVAPSRGVDPDGLVIIGRSTQLNERERETLAHNNQHRKIKVITYDELLDDFGTLILHRLDDTRA